MKRPPKTNAPNALRALKELRKIFHLKDGKVQPKAKVLAFKNKWG
jgi:hypothetical protein